MVLFTSKHEPDEVIDIQVSTVYADKKYIYINMLSVYLLNKVNEWLKGKLKIAVVEAR